MGALTTFWCAKELCTMYLLGAGAVGGDDADLAAGDGDGVVGPRRVWVGSLPRIVRERGFCGRRGGGERSLDRVIRAVPLVVDAGSARVHSGGCRRQLSEALLKARILSFNRATFCVSNTGVHFRSKMESVSCSR